MIGGAQDGMLYTRRTFARATVADALAAALGWACLDGHGLHIYDLHLEWEHAADADSECVIVIYSGTEHTLELLDDESESGR